MPEPLAHSPEHVEQWLNRVYRDAPGLLSVVHQDAAGKFHGAGGTVPDIPSALQRVARLDAAGAKGIYVRTTTLARDPGPTVRGGEDDTLTLLGMWSDLDYGQVGHAPSRGPLHLPPDEHEARRIVTESGLPSPSLVVHSGGGLYAWWLLDEPLVLTDELRPMAKDISTRWQHALARSAEALGYEYGAGVGDLARVLRVPGTVNRKSGLSRPCRVVEDDGTAYTLTELMAALDAVAPPPRPAPAPAATRDVPVRPRAREGASAFDALDQHCSFDDILAGAGFTLHQVRHPAAVDQCWTRPGDPDSPCSAHTLKANVHVLVVHSTAAGLPDGGGQRLTRGRVFAQLHHGGDERAAALDLFAAMGNRPSTAAASALPLPRETPRPMTTSTVGLHDLVALEEKAARLHAVIPGPPGVDPETGEVGPDYPEPPDPADDTERDEFWTSRPELAHLRDFARARRAAPWAVLGCTLTRVVAHVEPFVTLPPIVGGDASLNLFLGLVGPSGAGKGAAESAAKDAVRFTRLLETPPVEAGVGSGEGIAHTYLRYVPGKKGEPGTVEQHATRALFRAPEVDTLAALKGRQGSTLLPKLRDAWIGDSLGFAYADVTRRLDLRAHQYRLCLIVGIQPNRAAVLLDDADGGTPQRFLWLPTMDPNVPEQAPPEPDPIEWRMPALTMTSVTSSGRHRLPVCDTARAAVDRAAVDRHHGKVDALNGHALLSRLKTAAALALLNGRAEVTDDDWALAGTVLAVSDATRASVVRSLGDRSEASTIARGRAEGLRAVVVEETKNEHAAQRVSRLILRKLGAGWTTRSDLRKALPSRDRTHFDDAMDRLTTAGLIQAEDMSHDGSNGTQYRRKDAAA